MPQTLVSYENVYNLSNRIFLGRPIIHRSLIFDLIRRRDFRTVQKLLEGREAGMEKIINRPNQARTRITISLTYML